MPGVQLLLAYSALLLIGLNDGAVGVLLPGIQQHYGLDKGGVSSLFFAGTVGYLTAAISSGLLHERLGWRAFLTSGAAAMLGGMVLLATAPPWIVVLALIGLSGWGVGVLDAGLNSYLAARPDNSARLNYMHACYGVGALGGPPLAAGILAADAAWNMVYAVLAGIALLVTGGLAVGFRSEPIPAAHGEQPGKQPGGNVLAAVLARPVVWLAAGVFFFYVGTEASVGDWTYSLLTQARSLDTVSGGWLVSGYWLGLTLGRLALGRATVRFGAGRVLQTCLAGVLIGLGILWFGPGTGAAGLGLLLAGFCLGPIYPTGIAVLSRAVPQRLLPSAVGVVTSLGAGGAALCPWLAGNLADRLGLEWVLPYAVVLTCGILIFWLAFRARLPATPPVAMPES